MMSAQAEYRRKCDTPGNCQVNPIVVCNPQHSYLQHDVMVWFTLLHERGHHAYGDTAYGDTQCRRLHPRW